MKEYAALKEKGYTILRNKISQDWVNDLKSGAYKAFEEHRQIQIRNGNDIQTEGVALHVLLSDPIFIKLLHELNRIGVIEEIEREFFDSKFIMNSMSALNNLPSGVNFSGKIHRDIRFYSGDVPLMLNALILLDDFTEDNGPTLLLPYSHTKKEQPSDDYFFSHCEKAIGKAGDVLLFNANTFHCSSPNRTTKGRMGLPITFTKSSMKQLLDYPRAIGYDKMNSFDEDVQRLLGYHSRVPASLNEWYMPAEDRLYKQGQG